MLMCCRHDDIIARVYLVHLMNVEQRQSADNP